MRQRHRVYTRRMVRRLLLIALVIAAVYYGATWSSRYFTGFRERVDENAEATNADDSPLEKGVKRRQAAEQGAGSSGR